MKIVYIINNIRRCGPLNVLNQIIKHLPNDYDISIVSIFGDRDDESIVSDYKDRKINVYSLKLNKYSYLLFGKHRIKKLLSRIQPDVIHSHGIIPDMLICNLTNYYRISTIHSNIYEDYINRFGKYKGRFYIWKHKKSLKKIDKRVAVSKFISDILNNNGINSTFIRNGIDFDYAVDSKKMRNQVEEELEIPKNSIIYIFCGSLYVAKGVKELVNKFVKSHCDNEYLIIMGSGPEKENIEKDIDNHIIMLGHVKNVAKYYSAADIYVSNSKTEGFSISVLEALCTKNLLLLSNIPSHNECMNMKNDVYLGELFEENNFEEMKNKVSKSVGKFDKNIIPYISAKRMTEEYIKIYRNHK